MQADLFVNEGLDSFNEYGCVQALLGQQGVPLLMLRATTPLGQELGVHEGRRPLLLCRPHGLPQRAPRCCCCVCVPRLDAPHFPCCLPPSFLCLNLSATCVPATRLPTATCPPRPLPWLRRRPPQASTTWPWQQTPHQPLQPSCRPPAPRPPTLASWPTPRAPHCLLQPAPCWAAPARRCAGSPLAGGCCFERAVDLLQATVPAHAAAHPRHSNPIHPSPPPPHTSLASAPQFPPDSPPAGGHARLPDRPCLRQRPRR